MKNRLYCRGQDFAAIWSYLIQNNLFCTILYNSVSISMAQKALFSRVIAFKGHYQTKRWQKCVRICILPQMSLVGEKRSFLMFECWMYSKRCVIAIKWRQRSHKTHKADKKHFWCHYLIFRWTTCSCTRDSLNTLFSVNM